MIGIHFHTLGRGRASATQFDTFTSLDIEDGQNRVSFFAGRDDLIRLMKIANDLNEVFGPRQEVDEAAE